MNTILNRGKYTKKTLYPHVKRSLSIAAAVAVAGGLVLVPQLADPGGIAHAAEYPTISPTSIASADPSSPTAPADPTWTRSEATNPSPTASAVAAGTASETATPSPTALDASPVASANPEPAKGTGLGAGIAVPLTVPPADLNSAVITVKVGGDRLADGTVAPLSGVKLGLYGPGTATTVVGLNALPTQGTAGARYDSSWSWTTCVSDADGDCSFVIPIRTDAPSITGAPQDTRFWVVEEASPGGWYSNPMLRIGGFGATPEGTLEYRFRTDTQLRAGVTYRSTTPMPYTDTATADNPDRFFMRNREDTNAEGRMASNTTRTTGVWSQSRNNPVFPAKCGMDIALIADTSGSLGDTGIAELKSTMSSFVDAFRGTDTNMSAFSFSTVSPGSGASNHPALLPVTTASQASTFKGQYAAWLSGGGTSWDRGLAEAANAAAKYDLAILLTDGNPTTMGTSPNAGASAFNSLRDTDAGIFSANQLKAEGTRVVALGVGPALTASSELNLRAVSGTVSGSDYIRAANFAAATAELVALANANCTGSIEVQKMIVPSNGTIADATPAPAGWKFDAASQTSTMTVGAPATRTTVTGGNGMVDFGLNFTQPSTSGTVQILETQQTGYQIVPVGTGNAARNGTCQILSTGGTVPVANSGTTAQPGFTVTGLKNERVSCKIYNKVLEPGKLEVAKSSNPASGTTVTPSQTLSYTLTFKNTGQMPVTVDQEDVLTGVLDDATLVAGSISAQTPLTAVLNGAGNRIKVTGELAPGDTKTVTYQVKVKDPLPDASDANLANFVVATGTNPPTTCDPGQPCTVHPVRVTLSWNKVDVSGNKLSGSEWKLVPLNVDGTPNQASAIVAVDCAAVSVASCTAADKDPVAGAFLLTGLVPGKYWLVETKAPPGYQLLTQAINLVVNTNLAYGNITNTQVKVPVIPLTGGMGSYLFMGAALICGVGAASTLLLQRRLRRK